MEAIRYEENIMIDLEKCIGCGLCASNCSKKAITLRKVRNQKLVKGNIGIFRKMLKEGKKRAKSKS